MVAQASYPGLISRKPYHVDVAALERAFRRQRRAASPGMDRVTVDDYERELEANLRRLHDSIHSGQYWPKPVRHPESRWRPAPAWHSGSGGQDRPGCGGRGAECRLRGRLHGVQRFRPERSPHAALAALDKALMTQRVDWVLDVDIRTFFDSVDHGW